MLGTDHLPAARVSLGARGFPRQRVGRRIRGTTILALISGIVPPIALNPTRPICAVEDYGPAGWCDRVGAGAVVVPRGLNGRRQCIELLTARLEPSAEREGRE